MHPHSKIKATFGDLLFSNPLSSAERLLKAANVRLTKYKEKIKDP